jgi:hypothetical protein
MPNMTKEELIRMRDSYKNMVIRIEQEANQLKGKHPRLYEEKLKKLKFAQKTVPELEHEIDTYEQRQQEQLYEKTHPKPITIDPHPIEEFNGIEFPYTIGCDSEIDNISRSEHSSIRFKHYKAILVMAQKHEPVHAKQMQHIGQWGIMHSAYDDIDLWSPLLKENFVNKLEEKPIGDQNAFFNKNRKGEYITKGKGMSGFEPSSHAISVFELTEKGWDKAKSIVTLTKNLNSKCYFKSN